MDHSFEETVGGATHSSPLWVQAATLSTQEESEWKRQDLWRLSLLGGTPPVYGLRWKSRNPSCLVSWWNEKLERILFCTKRRKLRLVCFWQLRPAILAIHAQRWELARVWWDGSRVYAAACGWRKNTIVRTLILLRLIFQFYLWSSTAIQVVSALPQSSWLAGKLGATSPLASLNFSLLPNNCSCHSNIVTLPTSYHGASLTHPLPNHNSTKLFWAWTSLNRLSHALLAEGPLPVLAHWTITCAVVALVKDSYREHCRKFTNFGRIKGNVES